LSDITKERFVKEINSDISSYLKKVQISTSNYIAISIDQMLTEIKSNNQDIKYFEFYGLNNYTPSQCQTIFWDKIANPVEGEIISIKQTVDNETSDIPNGLANFKLDVDMKIL
jgi:hypothetical protein